MKKRILMIGAVCAAACCLAACTNGKTPGEEASQYDMLNEMLHANYSQIEITVTDTFDEETFLKSEYTISYSDDNITVDYSVEKFAEISLDNPSTTLKNILTGEAVIKDGEVISGGDNINLTADIAEIGLNFQKEYFANARFTAVSMKADVKNAAGFLGREITYTGMKVNVTFLDVLYDIQITYTNGSGNKVEYLYSFTL